MTAIIMLVFIWGLPLLGFIAAVAALVGAAKYGPKGLLWQGTAGLLMNGAFIAMILFIVVSK